MGSRASLNHIYRTVWNQSLGAMVAVAEVASGRGKSSGSGAATAGRANLLESTVARIGLSAFAIACAWGSVATTAQANPNGGVAIHGQATQTSNGNQLLVTTQNGAGTNHAAINWQSFSIPSGSSTYFQQPGVSSTVINRVVTNTPSLIFGTLGSNGNVVLVNQSGITVGAGALVDTAGFTASALRMTDADAIAGRLRFGDGTVPVGGVSVQGSILARSGDVVLIGSNVDTTQSALVQAPNGSTVLAAGRQIEITGRGLEGISMLVRAPTDSAVNLGTLNGDAVGIFAGTLKTAGAIAATAVTAEGGKVFLKAADTTEIGGSVSAKALNGLGGTVHATADKVVVKAGASIDVSGQNGGGEALIGGGYQGKDARLANARRTLVEAGASIQADADTAGDGGTVVVWSDEATAAHGRISAKGGNQAGNGGLVETSGHALDVAGIAVSASAAHGKRGTWLLDPTDIVIGAPTNNVVNTNPPGYGGPIYEGTADSATVSVATLLSALNTGTDVTVRTTADVNATYAGQGNITVNSSITKTLGLDATLTLDAYKDILVNPGVVIGSTAPGGVLNVSLQSAMGAVTTTGATLATKGGNVNVTALGNISTGTISALGGDVTLTSNTGAVNTSGGSITSAGGTVGIYAQGDAVAGSIAAAGGTVNLFSTAGNVSQTGAIIANQLTVDATTSGSNGAITLTSAANNVALFVGYGTSISLRNASSSLGIVKALAWNGDISITNTGGIVIQDAVTGPTIETNTNTVSSTTRSVTLTSSNGAITSLATTNPAIVSNSVSLNAKTGIGSPLIGGNLEVPITVSVDINALDPISVAFVNTTGDVYISGAGDMNVQASRTGGSMNLVANNNLNLYGNLTAATGDIVLDAGAGDGSVDLDAGTVRTVLSAGRDVLISSIGLIDATGYSRISAGRDVTLTASSIDLWGAVTAGRNVMLDGGSVITQHSSGDLLNPSVITAKTLTTLSSGGLLLAGDGDANRNRVGTFSATDTGGGNIVFVNAGAFSLGTISNTGGKFQIYADSPDSVTKNGLTSQIRHYGVTYAALVAGGFVHNANVFAYRSTPTVASVAARIASGLATHEYAQTPTVVFDYSIAGIDREDVVGTPTFSLVPTSTTNAGVYQVVYSGGLSSTSALFGPPSGGTVLGRPLPALTVGAATTYTVTPRAQSNWNGSRSSLWSDAANWDVAPTLANVLSVNIPVGFNVVFDAGTTQLQSINTSGLLSVTGGALDVSSSLVAGRYTQSGGTVSGAGAFTVTDSFNQTGGAIAMTGPVSITQARGDLVVGNVSGGSVSLDAKTGAILQTAGISSAGLLKTKSATGTTLDNTGNSVAGFDATITGAGNVLFNNVGVLDVSGIVIPNGNLTLDNTGATLTSGAILVPRGEVNISTHSPMVIGSIVNSGGSIVLAALTPDGSSNITINGAMTSTAGGISVQAYNNFIQNSNLSAALAISVAAGGTLSFGPGAFSVGNPVNYSVNGQPYLPPWISATLSGGPTSFVDNFLGQFQTALNSVPFAIDDPLGLRERAKEGVVVEGEICAR